MAAGCGKKKKQKDEGEDGCRRCVSKVMHDLGLAVAAVVGVLTVSPSSGKRPAVHKCTKPAKGKMME